MESSIEHLEAENQPVGKEMGKGRNKMKNQQTTEEGGTFNPMEPMSGEVNKEDEKKQENEKKEPKDLIILKANIHCEGCGNKIIKCLRGFEGVEDVSVNANEQKVVVKGKKADPQKVLERVQKKCSKHAELISPKPKPKPNKDAKKKDDDDNEPLVRIVVIQVYIHCENCAEEIKRCILKMEGVQMVVLDLEKSQFTVTGAFEPTKLVDFLYKRAGKHAVIVKEDYQDKEKARKRLAKMKNSGGGNKNEGENNAPKEEKKKDFYYHYPPQYAIDYVYPSQLFSDENPNACSIM